MKFKKFTIYALALGLLGSFASCENPLKDFNLQISTEVIQHYATLKVVNSEGASVGNATITLVSGDVADIYNLSGVKDFKLTENLVSFGLDPKRQPSASNPIRFRVRIAAQGYNTIEVPISISGASTGIQTVTMIKPSVPVDGAEEVSRNIDLSDNGSTTSATVVSLPSSVGTGNLSLTIPTGTQFKDAAGNVVVGNSLTVSVQSIDGESERAQNLLPGASLLADKVTLADGTEVSGTFSPVAIANIRMFVNGTEIKSFSNPITINMPADPSYVSPITGNPIAAGNVFQLFSNSDESAGWKYEKNVTVTGNSSSGFLFNYTINHLSYYFAGEFGESCEEDRVITFSGDWMNNTSTYPIVVDYVWGDKVISSVEYSISKTNNSISISNIPAIGVSVVIRNSNNNILDQSPLASCGQVTLIALPNPGDATNATSTLQLYVRCPDKTETITLLPSFQMFYKVSGTSEYKYLGTVDNGFLRTTLLKTDGTKYDFKAIWNERSKEVKDKTVSVDNTATVGIQPGDILGTKAGATNLGILTEECGKL